MEENKKCSCLQCEHFTDTPDKNGYCKLHSYALTEPEEPCSEFKESDAKRVKGASSIQNAEFVISDGADSKSTFRNVSLFAALLGCSLLFLFLFFISVGIPIFVLNVSSTLYNLVVLGLTVLFLSLMTGSYFLIGKYIIARIVYIIVPTVILLLLLINYDSFWFNVSDFFIDLFSLN